MLLLATVLVTVITISIAGGSNVSAMMANDNITRTIAAQASLIRARILQCGTDYPTGNNGTTYRVNYPASATTSNASALTCPGIATGLWLQSDGVPIPVQPAGFGAWLYTNDATSMRLEITTATADRAALVPKILSILGPQAWQSGSSPSITITWVLAN